MPKGVYKRTPKPPDPFKWAKGKKIVDMTTDLYHTAVRVKLDDGSTLVFKGYGESMMFNDRWSAVKVLVESKV